MNYPGRAKIIVVFRIGDKKLEECLALGLFFLLEVITHIGFLAAPPQMAECSDLNY